MFSSFQCSNLMLIESIPGDPLSFHVIPFNNPRMQHTIQVTLVHVILLTLSLYLVMTLILWIIPALWTSRPKIWIRNGSGAKKWRDWSWRITQLLFLIRQKNWWWNWEKAEKKKVGTGPCPLSFHYTLPWLTVIHLWHRFWGFSGWLLWS